VLVVLGVTCLRVIYCFDPHHLPHQECGNGKGRRRLRRLGSDVFLGLGGLFTLAGICGGCVGVGLLITMATTEAEAQGNQSWLPALVSLSLAASSGGLGIWLWQMGRSLERPCGTW